MKNQIINQFPLDIEEIDKLIAGLDESPVWKAIAEKGEARLIANNNMKLRAKICRDLDIKDYIIDGMKRVRNPSIGGKIGGGVHASKTYECPHCGEKGKSNGFKSWHFENCKSNTSGNMEARIKIMNWRDENKHILSAAGKKGMANMSAEDRIKGSKKAGMKNVESGHLASLRTQEHQRNASKAANGKKVLCPDGHVTSKPSATVYCKNRGLDHTKCIEITTEEYNNLKQIEI
jgi:hypothetical protein